MASKENSSRSKPPFDPSDPAAQYIFNEKTRRWRKFDGGVLLDGESTNSPLMLMDAITGAAKESTVFQNYLRPVESEASLHRDALAKAYGDAFVRDRSPAFLAGAYGVLQKSLSTPAALISPAANPSRSTTNN